MATITLADYAGSGKAPSVHSSRLPFHYAEREIDIVAAIADKGSALAAADVIEAVNIPANSIVIAAGLEVTEAIGGTVSACTLDVGVTGSDADAFVDGFDFDAAALGAFSVQPAAYQPIVVGTTADTVDVLIATLTDVLSTGKLRVWAIYADIRDQSKPGIAVPKS